MAKHDRELFDRLTAAGLRKKVARKTSSAVHTAGSKKPSAAVARFANELSSLGGEIGDRVKGGPAKRKAAAKKASRTRKQNRAARSAAAKKGARTRKRNATKKAGRSTARSR